MSAMLETLIGAGPHLLRTHVEADVGREHAAVLPAQRADPQQPVVPEESFRLDTFYIKYDKGDVTPRCNTVTPRCNTDSQV